MHWIWPTFVLGAHIGLTMWLVGFLLLRRGGTSDTRLAWIVFIVLAPFLGAVAYIFFGGARIAGHRRRRHASIHKEYCESRGHSVQYFVGAQASVPPPYDRVFALAAATSETDVLGGNALDLLGGPDDFSDRLVAAIDAAHDTVHLLSYIYLDDAVGQSVGEACIRACARGVTVRLQVDSVGSKDFLRSALRARLAEAGIHIAEMLPAKIVRVLLSRMDIRNHRKIIVIDNTIGWVGSRNIASPSFAPKAKFAPWVDCMATVRGPAVHDLQRLFLEDWEVNTGECHDELLKSTPASVDGDANCQIVGTGPNFNNEALTQILHACFYAASDSLVLTTPYYVPDAATEAALRAAALRGVKTTLIVPARNDSTLVGLASRSHYAGLIRAGVHIHEYQAGLLHAKTRTVDPNLLMIGPAHLDRRSLQLHLEVSMFGWSPDFASHLHFLQMSYLNDCKPVNEDRWLNQSAPSRLVYNLAGLLSPLL